ncbi:hypothetical protein GLYMA_10G047300v4 [Glycine max]|uniref:Uncharacterized protein n=1 Tax=Glycine max TaxID=3847 RepID=A0A0R0HPG0_SOYBN|nr:hypothetical protein GYH30_026979 [Glycine max]KRH32365.1 hypothetical protein GLYMA_10G047300v4 [Glycine max]
MHAAAAGCSRHTRRVFSVIQTHNSAAFVDYCSVPAISTSIT